MTAPRTLPIRVDPIPGEALDSWLAALAYRLHVPLGELLPAIGLPNPRLESSFSGLTAEIRRERTVQLRPNEITALAIATGQDPAVIESTILIRYDGRALSINPTTHQVRKHRVWGRHSGSRYCPACLAETSGRWQLAWRLG
ncbi:hypothetical protein D5S17_00530 [Pseudonocardiaceae bacterium YIM PH 21723]|nr:hypothetical protein D5S17_00530 [Pseudonocardiaceae bacterium YIM PH 21723]